MAQIKVPQLISLAYICWTRAMVESTLLKNGRAASKQLPWKSSLNKTYVLSCHSAACRKEGTGKWQFDKTIITEAEYYSYKPSNVQQLLQSGQWCLKPFILIRSVTCPSLFQKKVSFKSWIWQTTKFKWQSKTETSFSSHLRLFR